MSPSTCRNCSLPAEWMPSPLSSPPSNFSFRLCVASHVHHTPGQPPILVRPPIQVWLEKYLTILSMRFPEKAMELFAYHAHASYSTPPLTVHRYAPLPIYPRCQPSNHCRQFNRVYTCSLQQLQWLACPLPPHLLAARSMGSTLSKAGPYNPAPSLQAEVVKRIFDPARPSAARNQTKGFIYHWKPYTSWHGYPHASDIGTACAWWTSSCHSR